VAVPDPLRSALRAAGQDALLQHLETLPPDLRSELVSDLASVEFEVLERARSSPVPVPGEIEPPEVLRAGSHPDADRARALGATALREGRVAAVLVAGGQGTRLGHAGPKGTYPASPLRKASLFQIFAEKLLAARRRHQARIPLYVMTSPENDSETRAYFGVHDRFGLPEDELGFFAQGTMPATDIEGRLLLAAPGRLFRSPDGHGGILLALRRSGLLARMAGLGIEHLFYFQVDNPLVVMVDPLFVGFHILRGSEFSAKCVAKRSASEKVGVFVRSGGRTRIIEYSDLPAGLREVRNPDGRLRFDAGSIAVHVLAREFVERLTQGSFALPFHLARKEIAAWSPGGEVRLPGLKYESFVFDALPLARRTCIVEVDREVEFSPIKNQSGEDSAESAMRDQVRLWARWLEAAGRPVPEGPDGGPRHPIEISPLWADDPEELRRRAHEIGPWNGPLLLQ
jgi:UDP-N-acetylglucosamine/UDP-N-acetylgalactosamine diphosphorylase